MPKTLSQLTDNFTLRPHSDWFGVDEDTGELCACVFGAILYDHYIEEDIKISPTDAVDDLFSWVNYHAASIGLIDRLMPELREDFPILNEHTSEVHLEYAKEVFKADLTVFGDEKPLFIDLLFRINDTVGRDKAVQFIRHFNL